MSKKFTEKEIRSYWSSGKKLTYKGKKYDVGKMSYGDYFLELPKKGRKEGDIFDSDTLWLEKKVEKGFIFYEIKE